MIKNLLWKQAKEAAEKKFGNLNATMKASAIGPAPNVAAIRISRMNPVIRLIIV